MTMRFSFKVFLLFVGMLFLMSPALLSQDPDPIAEPEPTEVVEATDVADVEVVAEDEVKVEEAAVEGWGGLSDRPTAAELRRGQTVETQVPIGVKIERLDSEGEMGAVFLTFITYHVDHDGELVMNLHSATLFDSGDERQDQEHAFQSEVELLLDSEIIQDTYIDDDTGETIEKTGEEKRAEAEHIAETADLEIAWPTADDLWREVREAMSELEIPKMIEKVALGFYAHEDDDEGYSGDELDIRWLTDDEWTFLTVIESGMKARSGHGYRIPPEFTLTALQIFERIAKSSWAKDIAMVIPVWSLRSEDDIDVATDPKEYNALCKRAAWVGENPEKIHPLLQKKLRETDLGKEVMV